MVLSNPLQITHDRSFSVHRCSNDIAGPIQLPNRKVESFHIGDLDMDFDPRNSLSVMVGDKEVNWRFPYNLMLLL